MDSPIFSRTKPDTIIVLRTAVEVAQFSFIVQDSLSYLDLKLCTNERFSDYFSDTYIYDGWRSKSLPNFVNTEEKCQQFFAPRRRLLYTLHLDLPKGREPSLKEGFRHPFCITHCCTSLHTAIINLRYEFYNNNLCDFIKYAVNINLSKVKILKWATRIPFSEMELLSSLDISIASQFIDCFYPEVTDYELFSNFLKQFEILQWMGEFEQPEILEFLLHNVRLLGNINWYNETAINLIRYCLQNKFYRNIGPVLKYISDGVPSFYDYLYYLFHLDDQNDDLDKNVRDATEKRSITFERIGLLIQVITAYTDSRQHGLQAAASEALRLIWSSIPDACLTFGELQLIFRAEHSEEELRAIHAFYVRAIGEFHQYVEPRSLQHLCRTALRRTFQRNKLWIPDAISRTGLPKSLQAFLNLEKPFGA